MKILFCTNTYESTQNGPSKFARYLLELNERYEDLEIRILTEDVLPSTLKQHKGRIIKLDLRLNRFTRPWGFIYRMYPYYKACRALRAQYPYDVVVYNNAITGIWSARKLPVPVLGMINDYTSLATSWKSFDGSAQWIRRYLFKCCEKWACSVQAGLIVNSKYLFQQVVKVYKVPPEKVRLVYKGVATFDPPLRRPIDLKVPIKVLFVKADFRLGGLFDVMAALNRCPEFSFELYVVGPSVQFRDEIMYQPTLPHVKVHFIGPATQSEVYAYLQQCDLFTGPSYREALGVANIEALLHKVPVITSQVGGIGEVMNHGQNGWLVRPGQPQELADTIRYVLLHPAERAQKQENGYTYVRQHFSYESTLAQFASVVKEWV